MQETQDEIKRIKNENENNNIKISSLLNSKKCLYYDNEFNLHAFEINEHIRPLTTKSFEVTLLLLNKLCEVLNDKFFNFVKQVTKFH